MSKKKKKTSDEDLRFEYEQDQIDAINFAEQYVRKTT